MHGITNARQSTAYPAPHHLPLDHRFAYLQAQFYKPSGVKQAPSRLKTQDFPASYTSEHGWCLVEVLYCRTGFERRYSAAAADVVRGLKQVMGELANGWTAGERLVAWYRECRPSCRHVEYQPIVPEQNLF